MNEGKLQTQIGVATKPEEYDILVLGSGVAGKLSLSPGHWPKRA